ncbi:hypothetical protein ALP8811_02506 [Aliiroseovarius pelagivivens]|uniref:Inner membrane protein YjgN n=1 Tax=Aliiroseovarius pelagivivens TaxID=1639690 RepID=A0A2R8ARS9_9RHOB|nr:DUF898 family protein [Aliiroseovarius pelagivivens]SPF78577.1 hypothetical protein ALP8811_02506 [Aliiroseovarius pelagivivens]
MPPSSLTISYAGEKGPVFWLALRTSILTVLTLGFYRFWAKTRLRRYYWSAIRPGGAPLEYVGDPLEKLLGFLVAVVFMAFYIGVVNLILMYFSFALLNANFAAYALSFLGLTPIIFFAQYRARRYILARTRWRGIRFGLEPGAWGYSWRSMIHWALTICTLGLTWPLTTLWLEKYRVSRTFYGDQRFVQGGSKGLLFGAMRHVYYAIGLGAIAGLMLYLYENPAWIVLFVLSGSWLIYGLAYWRAESFKRMTDAKQLGEMQFTAKPRPLRIIGIYALGGLVLNIVLFGLFFALLMVFAFIAGTADIENINLDLLESGGTAFLPVALMAYFLLLTLTRAITHAWITLPLAEHFAEVTEIVNTQNVAQIIQRDRDEFAEAEGFADALDVGAAI